MKLVHVVCVLVMLTAACAPAAEPGGAPNSASLVGTPSIVAPPTSTRPPPPTAKTPTPTQAVKAMPEPTVDNQSRIQPTAPPQATVINCKQKAGVPLDAKKGEAAFVSGMNRFGFDYYRAVTDGEGKSANLIYSPYSISTAFSMVYAGACSNTETQIAKVLGFLPQASHHAASETLQRRLDELAFRPVPNQRTGNLPFQLRDANAVWGQTGYPFADAYQRVLAEHYGSRVRPVDFISDVEGGRKLVNDRMWKETEQHIKDILPEGSVDMYTRLILANAIYFKALWQYPFLEEATEPGSFTLLDGSRVTVPMMTQDDDALTYAATKDYEAAVLPYAGDGAEMVLIVPKTGKFEKVDAGLDAEFLEAVRAKTTKGEAHITMPRFKFQSAPELHETLSQMGMPDAFCEELNANFTGMNKFGINELCISKAFHRATFEVNEKGTEAAAATVTVIRLVSGRQDPPNHLVVDRPFVFAIVEKETVAVLFIGRVMSPK